MGVFILITTWMLVLIGFILISFIGIKAASFSIKEGHLYIIWISDTFEKKSFKLF